MSHKIKVVTQADYYLVAEFNAFARGVERRHIYHARCAVHIKAIRRACFISVFESNAVCGGVRLSIYACACVCVFRDENRTPIVAETQSVSCDTYRAVTHVAHKTNIGGPEPSAARREDVKRTGVKYRSRGRRESVSVIDMTFA